MEKKMKYTKYIIIIIVIVGGIFVLQVSLAKRNTPPQKEDINLDENGKQIVDNEVKSNKDDETIKGEIDKSKLTEKELKDYENYDPLGRNADNQETEGKE